jgi:(Z)-2-((N-methylformamido)methylene)-5-hydroxybutyrolactone dehydrogenase
MIATVETIESSRTKPYVGGEWVEPRSGRYLPSYDPATGEIWYEAGRHRGGRRRHAWRAAESRSAPADPDRSWPHDPPAL